MISSPSSSQLKLKMFAPPLSFPCEHMGASPCSHVLSLTAQRAFCARTFPFDSALLLTQRMVSELHVLCCPCGGFFLILNDHRREKQELCWDTGTPPRGFAWWVGRPHLCVPSRWLVAGGAGVRGCLWQGWKLPSTCPPSTRAGGFRLRCSAPVLPASAVGHPPHSTEMLLALSAAKERREEYL